MSTSTPTCNLLLTLAKKLVGVPTGQANCCSPTDTVPFETSAESLIGAKALVKQGMKIPPGSLVVGMPARVVRALTDDEKKELRASAEKYAANAAYCLKNKINVGGALPT